jgi:hypothetical protein
MTHSPVQRAPRAIRAGFTASPWSAAMFRLPPHPVCASNDRGPALRGKGQGHNAITGGVMAAITPKILWDRAFRPNHNGITRKITPTCAQPCGRDRARGKLRYGRYTVIPFSITLKDKDKRGGRPITAAITVGRLTVMGWVNPLETLEKWGFGHA